EPLSNLDASLREEMRAEIRSLQRKLSITTVLVTHDQGEALSIADRVAVMNAGRLEQLGAPGEIYRAPATPFVASFVGGGNVIAAQSDGGQLRVGALAFAAPSGARSGAVSIVVRPEEVRLDPAGAPARVEERLYLGDRVELRLDLAGTPLRALVPAAEADAATPGASVKLRFARAHILPA
ncbi:MAG TPA: ABC transporter ATP-binding protein, partial [bacterium]|nr:ABC transporter ATP-binding protein [bacterium]